MKKIFNLMLIVGIVPSVMAANPLKELLVIAKATSSINSPDYLPPYEPKPSDNYPGNNKIQNEAILKLKKIHNHSLKNIKDLYIKLTNTITVLDITQSVLFMVIVYRAAEGLLNLLNYTVKQIAAETIEPETIEAKKNITTSSKLSIKLVLITVGLVFWCCFWLYVVSYFS